MTGSTTGKGSKMTLAAMKGGTLASVPARLLFGLGQRHKAVLQCGVPAALVPHIRPLGCCRVNYKGTTWRTDTLSLTPPLDPPATPPSGGTGSANTSFWGVAKNLQRECTDEALILRLDLGRELAATHPLGDAPPYRLPVPNRGTLFTPPKWNLSSNGSD
jgi:hypothetical protein